MSKPSSLSLLIISTTTTTTRTRSSSVITTRPYYTVSAPRIRSATSTTATVDVGTFVRPNSIKPNTSCRRRCCCGQQQQKRSLSSSNTATTTITTNDYNYPIRNIVGRYSKTIVPQYPYSTKQSLLSTIIRQSSSSSLPPIIYDVSERLSSLPEYKHHRRRWFASTVPIISPSSDDDEDNDTYQHNDKKDKPCNDCPYSSSSSLPSNKARSDEINSSLIKEYGQQTNTTITQNTQNPIAPCGEQKIDQATESTSSGLPEPKYSFRRRVLVTSPPEANTNDDYVMIPLNTHVGKQYLIETLQQNTAASYIALTEHFMNQDDPAYCGITTLLVVLNALSVDPTVVRWKGGWRYFANESVLLALHPCLNETRIKNGMGITMEQFHRVAKCQGLYSIMKRPQIISSSSKNNDEQQGNKQQSINSDDNNTTTGCSTNNERYYSLDEFRNDIQNALTEHNDKDTVEGGTYDDQIVVVSFSRSALHQTGDGHFSPIAAYHRTSDTVLILDVARFKYQPYWVSISTLYNAMIPLDSCTNKSRGWFVLQRTQSSNTTSTNSTIQISASNNSITSPGSPNDTAAVTSPTTTTTTTTTTKQYTSNWKSIITNEDSLPARLIPLAEHGTNPCPIHPIKVNYCEINNNQQVRPSSTK